MMMGAGYWGLVAVHRLFQAVRGKRNVCDGFVHKGRIPSCTRSKAQPPLLYKAGKTAPGGQNLPNRGGMGITAFFGW